MVTGESVNGGDRGGVVAEEVMEFRFCRPARASKPIFFEATLHLL